MIKRDKKTPHIHPRIFPQRSNSLCLPVNLKLPAKFIEHTGFSIHLQQNSQPRWIKHGCFLWENANSEAYCLLTTSNKLPSSGRNTCLPNGCFMHTCIPGARSNSKRRPWNPTVRCWANWPRFHVQLGSSNGWTMGRKDTRNGWNAPWYMLYTCLSTHVIRWVETILWWYELYDSYYSRVVTVITVTCSMSTRVL